jgi:hypothetical protein
MTTQTAKYTMALGFAGDSSNWESLTMDQVIEKIAAANAMIQRTADFDRVENKTIITLGEFHSTNQGWQRAEILINGATGYGFIIAI